MVTGSFAYTKVYDCFPFYNEFEILQIRLDELDDVVDYFVLVESIETQRGMSKPLYFSENRALFEKYKDKIIHVVIDETHPEMGMWQRENFQRNAISLGLKNCASDDIIIISDVDEIPRAWIIQDLRTFLHKNRALDAVALEMPIFFFQLNRRTHTGETWGGGPWIGTVATTYKKFSRHGAQYFRNKRAIFPRIYNGGWHFTWMGGKEKIRQKLCSVVEGREDGAQMSDEEIDKWIQSHPVFPLDMNFPNYVKKNEQYFRSIGFIADY
jgi:beta-1,4-mannosyl-glycoprotein beta-1,4-N-acetylglucosaminyltransferase